MHFNNEDLLGEGWEDDCGYDPDFSGICHHVGTEDCQFFCPFHNIYFAKKEENNG
jgi:hypothetical protein